MCTDRALPACGVDGGAVGFKHQLQQQGEGISRGGGCTPYMLRHPSVTLVSPLCLCVVPAWSGSCGLSCC